MKRIALLALLALPICAQTVLVDLTGARRGIFHSHIALPAAPGPMTLVYPKWVPGEHTASGPLMQMAGLHIRAGERELEWSRDRVEMFAFHIDVPPGVSSLTIDFDYVSPSKTFGAGYGESANATQNLALILFNHHVLYPAGVPSDRIAYRASIRLPAGWKFNTALRGAERRGDEVEFAPVSLTALVDSPIVAGAFTREVSVGDAQRIAITADSAPALAIDEGAINSVRRLVEEADVLFGPRQDPQYLWLVTLSDLLEPQGLEHLQSTDIRAAERAFLDADRTARTIGVLAHEYVHAWNGKFRRPAGLATPDFQQPMIGELLFVYEGMTRYFGDFILAARSGMRTPEHEREYAAWIAANLDRNRPGRAWRPLVDTAVGVSSLSAAPDEGIPYRRSWGDYYDESLLVWLDADALIRTKSGGKKSLDDFARLFFAKGTPYTLDDLVAALNQVAANDWRAFIDARVYRVTPHPPLGALEAAGWRLVYNDIPNWWQGVRERTETTNASLEVGAYIKSDGTISDVVYGSPAFTAGLVSGMKILAVNARKYDGSVLREEIRARKPLDVAVEQGTFSGAFRIEYRGGEQYPHLERIEGRPDLLTDIMRPRAARQIAAGR